MARTLCRLAACAVTPLTSVLPVWFFAPVFIGLGMLVVGGLLVLGTHPMSCYP